jgi:cobalt-zinc-cadmium efflux system outer membrane protein
MNRVLSILLILFSYSTMAGQNLQSFLNSVAEHHPEIIAYGKLLEARKLDARTGLTPPDPVVSYGYMPDRNDRSVVKKTWSVSQSFSLPVKYINQSKLSKEKIILAQEEYDLVRLNILLNSKLILYDYIYNEKKLEKLKYRMGIYERLKSGYNKLLETGHTTILDYNRILFEISELNLSVRLTETELSTLTEKLDYVTGGNFSAAYPLEYPPVIYHDLEQVMNEKINIHPAFLIPESEYRISTREAMLVRTGNLPEIQAGYSAEILPSENFIGPVAGLTIPLWSNSNKVKSADAFADQFSAFRDARILELKTETRSHYEYMNSLKSNISEIKELLDDGSTMNNLETALKSGEISLTEYFMYLGSYFHAEDRLLEAENEYNTTLAQLYDYELLQQ